MINTHAAKAKFMGVPFYNIMANPAYCEAFDIQSWIFRFVSILGERYTHGHVYDFYNSLSKNKSADEHISLDTQVALDIFENLKYDLKGIRLGQAVKPVYLRKFPRDLSKIKSTQKQCFRYL